MVRKRFNADEIDEDFLISTINNEKPAAEQKKEVANSPKPAQKKNQQNEKEYTSLFIVQSQGKARSGKLVPIRPEYHERISKIVQVISGGELSIFNYIDNVLTHHFDEFQEEIIKHYLENNKDIF